MDPKMEAHYPLNNMTTTHFYFHHYCIVVCNSTIIHSHHLVLIVTTYINRKRTWIVFPATSRKLTQRLEVTNPTQSYNQTHQHNIALYTDDETKTLHMIIITQICKIPLYGKKWTSKKHINDINTQLYIKIKSHKLHSNGYPEYYIRPQPCIVLMYINHWADRTRELLYTDQMTHPFSMQRNTTRILSPLYFRPMNMYYGLYPIDTDVSNFTAVAY